MAKLFGTDGIRGMANREPLTPELALRLGQVVAQQRGASYGRARLVVGRDTRRSADLLESALIAGICSAGADALLAGVLPTPAVAFLVRALGADGGIIVSASHNPYSDNGIKLFGSDGFKLPDRLESEIEEQLAGQMGTRPTGGAVGVVKQLDGPVDRYVSHLCEAVGGSISLAGCRLVIDCANGAASTAGPLLFQRTGAIVQTLSASPNGVNINDGCGALHPEHLQEAVRSSGAALGVALDGDADRVILVDENGAIVDGDEILMILADDWQSAGEVRGGAVVATVMSNLGLELALQQRGLKLIRTAVGDRHVVEAMREHGCILGGEQSGHVILMEHATTGDGLLAALSIAAIMAKRKRSLGALRSVMKRLPQALVNVRVRERRDLDSVAPVRHAIDRVRSALAAEGRVLIRYSGTEPVVRIMVEGPQQTIVEEHAAAIAAAVQAAIGLGTME